MLFFISLIAISRGEGRDKSLDECLKIKPGTEELTDCPDGQECHLYTDTTTQKIYYKCFTKGSKRLNESCEIDGECQKVDGLYLI